MTKRVAICARVSIKEQNPDPQIHALTQYVINRSFTIMNEYIDIDSGSLEKRIFKQKNCPAPEGPKTIKIFLLIIF